jgi:hypothetical protein
VGLRRHVIIYQFVHHRFELVRVASLSITDMIRMRLLGMMFEYDRGLRAKMPGPERLG